MIPYAVSICLMYLGTYVAVIVFLYGMPLEHSNVGSNVREGSSNGLLRQQCHGLV